MSLDEETDLEGPRVFRAGMCKSVSFHKKDLSTMKCINISDITDT